MELDILLLREKGQYIWIVFHYLVMSIEDNICSFFVVRFERHVDGGAPGDVEHHHVLLPLVSSLTAHLPLAVGRVEHLPTINSERALKLPCLWSKCTFLGSPSLKAITATATHPP